DFITGRRLAAKTDRDRQDTLAARLELEIDNRRADARDPDTARRLKKARTQAECRSAGTRSVQIENDLETVRIECGKQRRRSRYANLALPGPRAPHHEIRRHIPHLYGHGERFLGRLLPGVDEQP